MEQTAAHQIWKCRDITFDLSEGGAIMGILNVTPDSFSDGGRFSQLDLAVKQAEKMIREGAAIIDIGGESTRPGAEGVPENEELERTIPVLETLARRFPKVCLSIDTSKPEVARLALEAGAHILNDVTGFRDPEMIEAAADSGAGVVVMHMLGEPRTMQQSPHYENVLEEVKSFFDSRIGALKKGGIDPSAIVVDPGIGFGKTLHHNLVLLRRIDELTACGRPVLLGVSKKSFIGTLIESEKMEDRSLPTVAVTAFAAEKGVFLHRVHEVKENLEALRMMEAIQSVP